LEWNPPILDHYNESLLVVKKKLDIKYPYQKLVKKGGVFSSKFESKPYSHLFIVRNGERIHCGFVGQA
jgi:hypothetical protein